MSFSSGPEARAGRGGFTLFEVLAAMTLLVLGLIALGAVVVSASQRREEDVQRQYALDSAQGLMEEIRSTAPELATSYDGRSFPIAGSQGSSSTDSMSVDIDDSNPQLLLVKIQCRWDFRGRPESLVLATRIHNSKG